MSDYKNTLNLPQTDFAMKANLAEREPLMLKKWQDMQLFSQIRDQMRGKKKFILHSGPPYANGHIHLGTATNTILKDIIIKSKTLSGFDAPYVPGWDCHGLPIEHHVEKKIGKANQKVSASEFRKACRDYANHFIQIQREEFQRLGIIADWEHPYLTMDFSYEANTIRALGKIIGKQHVQKGYKPVHWCLDCASALAEAEVEYADKTSTAIDVRFIVVDNQDFWGRFDHVHKGLGSIAIPIWTTTPWSLPGNQAVALNPRVTYVLIASAQYEQLLIAEDLLPSVLTRYGIAEHTVLGKVLGEKLLQVQLKHPFYDKIVPVVMGEHVTVDSGTGAVHTAPAHGQDDFVIGKQYHLSLDNPIADNGCYLASVPLLAGVHVRQADAKIIELMKANGTLLHEAMLTHSYPHCWRHKSAIIFRATPQWFISMEQQGLRQQVMQAIDQVAWIPEWGASRIRGMVENRPDWCISRQRTWGVPITVFLHKESGELHPRTLALLEAVAKQVEVRGIDAWFDLDISSLLGEEACHYQKVNDVLDVWFDSGVSHECVLRLRPELAFPADIVLEGSDQHRGWFQSLLLTSVAINDVAPYKTVLTHGFVVDGQGRKMSKSLGNVIAPEEVIKTLGADILRLWVASVDYRTEINASKEILARMSETYRRIRNTARFLLANLHGFDPQQHLVPTEDMLMLDRYIVDKARLVQQEILQAYTAYQFHVITQKLHHFCVVDLGGFYLDVIKDRQYTMPTNSRGRRSAETALFHIAQALVRWLSPILSFTAEEIWQFLPGKTAESVFLCSWYEQLAALPETLEMNQAYWEKIRAVRDAVNKEIENQRNAGNIGSALEAEVSLYCAPALKKMLDALQQELHFVFITSAATVFAIDAKPSTAIATDVPDLALQIKATTYAKCERCWHRLSDVDAAAAHPGLCGRCVINAFGSGEVRKYA